MAFVLGKSRQPTGRLRSHEDLGEKIPFLPVQSHPSKETAVSIFICIVQAFDVVQLHGALLEKAEVPARFDRDGEKAQPGK